MLGLLRKGGVVARTPKYSRNVHPIFIAAGTTFDNLQLRLRCSALATEIIARRVWGAAVCAEP